jgi:hypothetical protein
MISLNSYMFRHRVAILIESTWTNAQIQVLFLLKYSNIRTYFAIRKEYLINLEACLYKYILYKLISALGNNSYIKCVNHSSLKIHIGNPKRCNNVSKFILYLYKAQHVSGDTPPIIRSLKLH